MRPIQKNSRVWSSVLALSALGLLGCPSKPSPTRAPADLAESLPAWAAAPAPPTAPAPDGCARGEPEPILKSRNGAAPQFRRAAPLQSVEILSLRAGVTVQVRQLGCAHYIEEITFRLTKSGESRGDARPADWLRSTAELLESLPVVSAHQGSVLAMAQALRRAITKPYSYGTPLTISETDSVSLQISSTPTDTLVMVTYDVAL